MTEYTNLRAQFVEYDSPLFTIWRAWDVPATASYVLFEATPGLPADPDYPGMVLSDTAILFTRGRWQFANPDLPGGSQTFAAGDGAFRHRLPGRYRVMGLDDTNGQMCVRPKDGAIWNRQAVMVPNHEDLTLGLWPEDRYLFVGSGALELDGGEPVLNTVPFKIPADSRIHVTARAATMALLLWPGGGLG